MTKPFLAAVTRISDLAGGRWEVTKTPRDAWETGDYVCAVVERAKGPLAHVELATGRFAEVARGDRIVGALARRYATLEVVGDWRRVNAAGRLDALTSAGLFGRATSVSPLLPPLLTLRYLGHVARAGRKVAMRDFALTGDGAHVAVDTILVVGTSMSAGKTAAAKVILRQLAATGRRAVGAKLTGAGRYQDILAMRDAGAEAVYDFMDAGLPSTVCPAEEYRTALRALLARIAEHRPDVLVAEAGASPFEPYNGSVVLEELAPHVRAVVLCSSDPYAVVGVIRGFGVAPDLVSGPTANTSAGRELVRKLAGVPADNLLEAAGRRRLAGRLERWLRPTPPPADAPF